MLIPSSLSVFLGHDMQTETGPAKPHPQDLKLPSSPWPWAFYHQSSRGMASLPSSADNLA